jgi:mono/diheme cytochrome c family protein
MAGAVVLIVLVVAAVALVGGLFLGRATRGSSTVTTAGATGTVSTSVDPYIAAGAHDFVNFACAQCHGLDGRGGVSPYVPSLSTVGKALTATQLEQIINHGLGESKNPTHPYMPVWGEVISTQQVNDLVAYIRAGLPKVPTATPIEIPNGQGLAVQGQALYSLYGCINCHGPNGLGGVPNPLSPDKTIPVLSGAAFRHQFNTNAKIIAVINRVHARSPTPRPGLPPAAIGRSRHPPQAGGRNPRGRPGTGPTDCLPEPVLIA